MHRTHCAATRQQSTDVRAQRAQRLGGRSYAVGFLDAQLLRAAYDRAALGKARHRRQQRQFVYERRHVLRRYRQRTERALRERDVRARLRALLPVRKLYVRAHAPQRSEQTRARGIDPHPPDRHSAALDDRRRAQKVRRGGNVARDAHVAGGDVARAYLGCQSVPAYVRAHRAQHEFGVIAREQRLRHARDALGVQPREQYRTLDLRARHFERYVRAVQTRGTNGHGDLAVRGRHVRAHERERLRHAQHGASAQAVVPVYSGGDVHAREQSHQKPRGRA